MKRQNNKLLLLLFFVTKKRMRKLSFCNSMVEVSHLQLSYVIIHEMYIYLSFCDTCAFVNNGWLIWGTLHKRFVGVWIAQCRPTEITAVVIDFYIHSTCTWKDLFLFNQFRKQDDFLCFPSRTFLLYVCLFCLGTDGIYIILRLFHRGLYRLNLSYTVCFSIVFNGSMYRV